MHQHPHLRKDLSDELRRGLDERAALMSQVSDGGDGEADPVVDVSNPVAWHATHRLRALLHSLVWHAREPRVEAEVDEPDSSIPLEHAGRLDL